MSLLDFKVTDYEPTMDYPPIPEGFYLFLIEKTEIKPTLSAKRNNTNECFLNLKLRVIEGQFKGRYVWDQINIVNSKIEAQDIARRRLRGVSKITETEEILDKTRDTRHLEGKLISGFVEIDSYNGKEKNKIKSYRNKSDSPVINHESTTTIPDDLNAVSSKLEDPQDDIPF